MEQHQLDHPEAIKQKKRACQTTCMQESRGCDMLQAYDLSQPLNVCTLILIKSSKFYIFVLYQHLYYNLCLKNN